MTTWLVRQAQAGNGDAFVQLMDMYKMDLYKVARGFFKSETDVADAMSETLLAAFEHIKDVREPAYFKTWLIRILINKCKDMVKDKKRYSVVEAFPERGAEDMRQEDVEFRELLNILKPQYRILMILYYGEGFNARQISEIMDMKESTVRTWLRRVRMQLKAELDYREVGE